MLYRLIACDWWARLHPDKPKVLQGEFTDDQIVQYNTSGYNIYFLPNYPSNPTPGVTVTGRDIDTFRFVFADCDIKDKYYDSKEAFLQVLKQQPIQPTLIVDSGHGIHAYYEVSGLDAKSYLLLQRRLSRHLHTDGAVSKIFQLMRLPNTLNTKKENDYKSCHILDGSEAIYTPDELDKWLPTISIKDKTYCEQHYNKTYQILDNSAQIPDSLPAKFGELLENNKEVREIWAGGVDDRSKSDYRLAHIMLAHGFTRTEAASVLMNAAKALSRTDVHRIGYADNIVSKIWTYEQKQPEVLLNLSSSVGTILKSPLTVLEGTRLPCWTYFDDTVHGFRLGQIIGLVAGVGVGKTAIALNMFMGFVQNNPNLDHMFVALEQPAGEIAKRWQLMCGDNTALHEKVQVMSNYDENGQYRHLSLSEIQEYIIRYQAVTGRKIGCVVIDHIGVLKKSTKNGENQGLIDICQEMKAFTVATNTLLIMQSQAPREKAGIGDIEMDKNAAYGTVFFEAFLDYLVTVWQPLKRCYSAGAPTVTAFKFCKIRHKNQGADKIIEDVCYRKVFDVRTGRLRNFTDIEEKQFTFFLTQSTNKRKANKLTDIVEYQTTKGDTDAESNNNRHPGGTKQSDPIHH